MKNNKKLPDPRVVFAVALFFSFYGVVFRTPIPMAALFVLALGVAAGLGVSPLRLLRRFKRLWQVVLLTAFLQSVFAPSGATLVGIGGFTLLSAGGAAKGLAVLFRLATFITCGAMFTQYPSRTLIQGMVQIRLPYEIAYMVSVGVRFVPKMNEELRDSLTAIQLRGVVIEDLGFQKRMKLYGYLLLPVVASSLFNAQELAKSMDMRAFRAFSERSCYRGLALGSADKVMLLGVLCAGIMAGIYFLTGVSL